jgi:hypothetical protein
MRPPEDAIESLAASIEIAAPPDKVYGLVSDIARMGEWSLEAVGGRWIDGGTGQVGDWFMGENATAEREWERECEVAAAEPGVDFTFVVGGVEANCTWWSYELEPIEAGTRLTERWWIVNKTPAVAAAPPEAYAKRVAYTQTMLDQTVGALKAAAEQ